MQKIVLHLNKKLIVISVFFCLCSMSNGQETSLLNAYRGDLNPAQQKVVNTLNAHRTTKRTRVATIIKEIFEQGQITANLFSDQNMLFSTQDIGITGVSNRSWTGNSIENLGSMAVIINGRRISAHITSVEGNFEIIPLDNNGTHLILEHDLSHHGTCGTNELAPAIINTDEPDNSAFPIEVSRPQRTSVQSECRIRLLVAYTPGAKTNTMSTYHRTMIEHTELAILQMNQGYANSLVNQRVELAYLYETTDEETGNDSDDINDLRDTSDGKWDEIHDLRDLYSADMVALITDGSYTGTCGISYGFNYELEANMFQITEYNCAVANFTLAHEFSHLQGCRHDIDANVTPFDFGHGYSQGDVYRTIMAVCCGSPRVNYWSNPYVYNPGTGMMGTLNFNYNALALNNSDSTIAHHRITPSSINSDHMLGDDHLANNNTLGFLIATDTTMQGSCLILQSATKVRLADGFRAYNGSHGTYRISPGCTEAAPLTSTTRPDIALQRDSRPLVHTVNPSAKPNNEKTTIVQTNRDQRDR
ncbi:MAG: hypothetical protein DRI69_10005 [Bacteroidetes bacterium]|nr:MAG: hypothetical protein DRI69_10005 [Bacteroidota bacterium]